MGSTIQLALPPADTGSQLLEAQLPVLPAAQAANYLATQASSTETRQTLTCSSLLVGGTLDQAKAEAVKVLDEMLSNSVVLSTYGTDALEGVNRLIDQLLHNKEPVDIPEVRAIMQRLSREMRDIGKKYDPDDEKVRAKYAKISGRVARWFRVGKSFLQELLDDIRSLESKFDKAEETLQGKQYELIRNISFYDEYYVLNEEEITKLIYKIAVMELIRDLAANRADEVIIGNSQLGDRGGEEKAKLAEFVSLMETKIAAYKGRLWVAWAMSPQVRMMRTLNVGLAQKINETITIGIPTMKSTIAIWMTLGEAEQAKQLNEAVEALINSTLTQFATAASIAVPAIAEAVQTPALSPATVSAMAESIAQQADGVIAALEHGRQRRAELDAAMIEGKKVIDAATDRVNEAQVQHVLDLVPASLEIATSVPA